MTRSLTQFAAALLLAAGPGAALAAPLTFDGAWKHQKFSLFSQNDYAHRGDRLDVASDGTVSLTWRALPEARWGARQASWSWAVEEGVPATDLTAKGGDDRDLALYFVFLPEERAAELRDAAIRTLLSEPAARVLVYVWGGAHGVGEVLPSPYLEERGRTLVLHGAGTGAAMERVDLAADFARAFGGRPEALVGVAVSADSDDTESRIRARVENLVLD
ncbi:DUF3047 domain-containing protein [Roseivivax sp. CAU 1761]